MREKLIDFRDRQSAIEQLRELRDWEPRIIFTNGCFDLLHPGHVRTLCFCDDLRKADESALVVAINSDSSVRRLKGPDRPIVDEMSRAVMLAALLFVDQVVIFDETTPRELIDVLRPDVIVKGGDYEGKQIIGGDVAAVTMCAPYVDGWSTSSIVRKIQGLKFSPEHEQAVDAGEKVR